MTFHLYETIDQGTMDLFLLDLNSQAVASHLGSVRSPPGLEILLY